MRPRVCDVDKHIEQAYIGQRLARTPKDELYMVHRSPRMQVSGCPKPFTVSLLIF